MHTKEELKQYQQQPLELKIIMTQQRVREWVREFGEEGCYISFSGGKDSTVLKHIINQMYPDIPSVFVDTGLEYPEIKQFVKTHNDVTIVRPEKSFRQVITEYGYPVASKQVSKFVSAYKHGKKWAVKYVEGTAVDSRGRKSDFCIAERWKCLLTADFEVSNMCCDVMKKSPIKLYQEQTGRRPFIATMADEGMQREMAWLKTGCNSFDSADPISKPLSFWTEQDVLAYIYIYKLPYASVYGDIVYDEATGKYHTTGLSRTGCMYCVFGAHLEKSPNRFQRMRKTHPLIWDYCMRSKEEGGLGMEHVLDYCGIETGRYDEFTLDDFNFTEVENDT